VSRLTDAYVTYRILRLLATPIENSDAYKMGIINADGKKIKNPTTPAEKDAYSLLQRFIFKVQRALVKSPDRNAKRLLTVAAALSILREHDETTLETYTEQDIEALLDMYETDESVERQSKLLEHNVISFNTFLSEEGVVANAVGGGGIDGIGVGPKGEPGRDPVMMPMVRRKKKKKDANS
jgi:hypothetical protein